MTLCWPLGRRNARAPRGRAGTFLTAAGLGLVLAGCGSTSDTTAAPTPAESSTIPTESASPSSSSAQDRPRPTGSPRPMGHIHGVGRDAATGDVVLATHGGLFRLDPSGPTPVGPVVDLMGFAIAADGSYLASGHPGIGTDLANPVGLIRSTDGGATWSSLSRGGQSDFHGLSAGSGLVAGFDGALRVSTDGGRTWEARRMPSEPHTLAVSPSGGSMLATTRDGLLHSDDGGASWTPVTTPELLVAVDWADDETVAGVDLTGRLVLSEDGGTTWRTGPTSLGEVQVVHASTTDGGVEVLAVAGDAVLRTTDLGATTERLL